MPSRRARPLIAILAVLGVLASGQTVAPPAAHADTGVIVTLDPNKVTIRNALVERKWRDTVDGFRSTSFRDRRIPFEWAPAAGSREFTIVIAGLRVTSDDFQMESVEQSPLEGGGVRVTMHLTGSPLLDVDYLVDAYPFVAGFRTRTVLLPRVPILLDRYSLAEFHPRVDFLVAEGQTFHAGSDWRDEERWKPAIEVGTASTPRGGRSDWRVETQSSGLNKPYEKTGEFVSAHAVGSNRRVFIAAERPNLPSTRVSLRDGRVAADVDLARDILITGPLESDVHIENPTSLQIRRRLALPGARFELEPAFIGLATSLDDQPWQLTKYLLAGGWDFPRAVTFNTNTIDDNRLGVPGGAKDDVDQAEFFRQLDVAEDLGIETFILDDGWQLNSGDWKPDRSRFPGGFGPITSALHRRGMDLGLWMSPLAFHPNSRAFRENPTWSCVPVGTATGLANATPLGEELMGGSAEAGIGLWNPDAISTGGVMIADLEAKIERAITEYGSRYFKFDFMVWVDCVNPSPTDMYRYRESFVSMIDRLHARYPDVTFQIDETNDYRMWPYESVIRGPSWFQNGSPEPKWLLHNLWTVAPYVPTWTIGQAALGEGNTTKYGVDYVMAVSLLSHMTFWRDLTTLTPDQIARARFWVELYRSIRDDLGSMVTYPLLSDPFVGNSWAALQPWNPDTQRGYLFAFRQDSGQAGRGIPLRGLRQGLTYRVTDVVTGANLGQFTTAQLMTGITVSAPAKNSARILKIVRL